MIIFCYMLLILFRDQVIEINNYSGCPLPFLAPLPPSSMWKCTSPIGGPRPRLAARHYTPREGFTVV